MNIRSAAESDLQDVLTIESRAFGYDKEAELVAELLKDPTAEPLLSLLAFDADKPVGHILFTKVGLVDGDAPVSVSASILAPLAVIPEYQSQGVGGKLIQEGLKILAESGVELVFVLGHPDYYPRHGFAPAGVHSLEAPYPIPAEYAGAWMARELKSGLIGSVKGKVAIAQALDKPEHWRE